MHKLNWFFWFKLLDKSWKASIDFWVWISTNVAVVGCFSYSSVERWCWELPFCKPRGVWALNQDLRMGGGSAIGAGAYWQT